MRIRVQRDDQPAGTTPLVKEDPNSSCPLAVGGDESRQLGGAFRQGRVDRRSWRASAEYE
jgi:hypothetical protein